MAELGRGGDADAILARVYWAGVDVGGKRKGFHVAVVASSSRGLQLSLNGHVAGRDAAAAVLSLLERFSPRVVAVDSPRRPAPVGETQRPCEHSLTAAVRCGITGTRDEDTIAARQDHYYEWIQEGWKLYETLEQAPSWTVIECFPTATWARLDRVRPRDVSRERWSEDILQQKLVEPGLLGGLPTRRNQDLRDAIGAAYTARLYSQRGKTETFTCPDCDLLPHCGIVVPRLASRPA